MTRGSAITDTTTSARRRLTCRALLALLAFALGTAAAASDPTATAPSPAPASQTAAPEPQDAQDAQNAFPGFRFWKAPAALIERWPWEDGKYYPIRVKLFNEWLEIESEVERLRAEEDVLLRGVVPTLRIDGKLDGATLEGEGVYTTTATLAAENADLEKVSSALYRLQPFSFAISPFTDGSPDAKYALDQTLEESVAVYPDGRLYLPNSREMKRKFKWSQRGKVDKLGRVSFDFAFPTATSVEMTFETPSDAEVAVTNGIVQDISTGADGKSNPNAESDPDAAASSVSAPNVRKWRVLFGGLPNATVLVTRTKDPAYAERRLAGVRQELTYRVTREGLNLTSRFEFESTAAPPENVELTLDDPLGLVDLSWANQEEGDLKPLFEKVDGATKILVRFPKFDAGSFGALKVSAFCKVKLDEEYRLPSVRLSGVGLTWKETICRLAVEPPLALTSVAPDRCMQSRDSQRIPDKTADELAFKFFESDAALDIKLRQLRSNPPFDSVTDCMLGGDVFAKTTVFFKFKEGDDPRVAVPIAPGWRVDSALGPAGEAISWFCVDEPVGGTEESADAQKTAKTVQNLCLTFKKEALASQPTRVVLSARKNYSDSDRIDVDGLCPIDLTDNLFGAHALVLRSESSSQVNLLNPDGKPFVNQKTAPNFIFGESYLRDASPASLGGTRLYFGPQSLGVYAVLSNTRTNYSTSGTCACVFKDVEETSDRTGERYKKGFFTERWRLHCEPTSGSRVDRLVFFATSPANAEKEAGAESREPETPWKWSTSAEPGRYYLALPLSKEEVEALKTPAGYDAYEIRLTTSRSVPFDVNLSYQASFGKEGAQLPLILLPEAANSSFEVVVEAPLGLPFEIAELKNLTESTPPFSSPNEYESLKKAFRYLPNLPQSDEAPDADPSPVNLRLTVKFPTDMEMKSGLDVAAWCWNVALDSFHESAGLVRNRAVYMIENHGVQEVKFTPRHPDLVTVKRVWIDGREGYWENVPENGGIKCALPNNRRFLSVGVEYVVHEQPLSGLRQLTPYSLDCDLPALSSVWNAWTPPQYQTGKDSKTSWLDDRFNSVAVSKIVSLFSRRPSLMRIQETASRFSTRFSAVDLLAEVVERERSKEEENKSAVQSLVAAASRRANSDLTWGAVFGSQKVVDELFLPNAVESEPGASDGAAAGTSASARARNAVLFAAAQNLPAPSEKPAAAEPADAVETAQKTDPENRTPYGALDYSGQSFKLYIDRLGLANVAVTPNEPLPSVESEPVETRAARTLEAAGLVLLFLDEYTALLTNSEILASTNGILSFPLEGAGIARCQQSADAERLRAEINANLEGRYVLPDSWKTAENLVSPWSRKVRLDAPLGWNCTTVPLNNSNTGVFIISRYFLWALELFSFIAFIMFAVGFGFVNARFSLGALGLCAALLNVVFFEWVYVLRGIAWGAMCLFLLYYIKRRLPDGVFASAAAGRSEGAAAPKDSDWERDPDLVLEESEETSTQGFVDFSRIPPEERRRLQAPSKPEDENRRGATTVKTILTLAITASLALIVTPYAASKSNEPRAAATPQTGSVSGAEKPAAESSDAENGSADPWTEPYRVFVPVDERQENVGEYYWVPSEFYELIGKRLKERPRERNWRVIDARYDGSVNYNSLTGETSLFNLKATYTIAMDGRNATVAFPATPLAPDVGARFDRQAIGAPYEEQDGAYYFEIADVEPGLHELEITLAPPPFSETTGQIAIPVLSVPSSRLYLSVPRDAPVIDAPNSRGKVERGPDGIVAELGAVNELVISKQESSDRANQAAFDVEQLFLIRPRSTQTEVRSVFRVRATDAQIKTLDLECDPLYAFSGYCSCDEAEIESYEPPTQANNAIHITFREPVDKPITVRVNFVARNFSGFGKIQFPKITARGARSTKSWLAIADLAEFELERPLNTTVTEKAFLEAWGDGSEKVAAAYDLAIQPDSALVSLKANVTVPDVSYFETVVFGATETETTLETKITSESELFRLTIDVPRPFAVDTLALFDETGAPSPAPKYFQTEDGVTLVFSAPIKGSARLRMTGRIRSKIDAAQPFPLFYFRHVAYASRRVAVYCRPDVYLDWNPPLDWIPLTEDEFENVDTELQPAPQPTENRHVDSYVLKLFTSEEIPTGVFSPNAPENTLNASETGDRAEIDAEDVAKELNAGPTLTVRANRTSFEGSEHTFLFPYKTEGSAASGDVNRPVKWRARVFFDFSAIEGRFDRFLILADEAFDWKFEDLDPDLVVTETTTFTGAPAISVESERAFHGKTRLSLVADFKNSSDSIRLPRFQLAPSSPREDMTRVERRVFLPEQKEETAIILNGDSEKADADSKKVPRWNWQKTGLVSLQETTLGSQKVNKSTQALAQAGVMQPPQSDDSALASTVFNISNEFQQVADDSGLQFKDFQAYKRLPSASAALSSRKNDVAVSRATHSFYVNANNEFFGKSSFTIRPSELGTCQIIVPEEFQLLEATVNGGRCGVKRDGNSWTVDLASTPYVKRLVIGYRGLVRSGPEVKRIYGVKNAPVLSLELPRIVGSTPERTVWICAFEGLDADVTRWQVYYCDDLQNQEPPTREDRARAEREPISMADASELIFRIQVEKAASLLDAYESDLSHFNGVNDDDLPRLLAWWDREWRENASAVSQFSYPSASSGGGPASRPLTDRQIRAFYLVSNGAVLDAPTDVSETVSLWNAERYRETMDQKKKLDDAYRPDFVETPSASGYASPETLWAYGSGNSTRLLFGSSNGKVNQVVFAATPRSLGFLFTRYATTIWILALTAVLIHMLRPKSRARRIKSLVFGSFVILWAIVFFWLDKKLIGIVGAFLFSFGPAVISSLWRRLRESRKRQAMPVEIPDDDSKSEPGRVKDFVYEEEPGTTEALSDSDAASPANYEDATKNDSDDGSDQIPELID